jgi:hypothetical protein
MLYLIMSRVFFTPVLLRAMRPPSSFRVLEEECSSTMLEGLESEVSDRALKSGSFRSERWLSIFGTLAFLKRNGGFFRADYASRGMGTVLLVCMLRTRALFVPEMC